MDDLVIVSNRGPVAFSRDPEGSLQAQRGGGGLVSSLAPLVQGTPATWFAAAMTDADREAAAAGVTEILGFHVRWLSFDPVVYRMAYDVVSNATLWFLAHRLFDLSRRPRIDQRWRQAWDAYRAVNEAFAAAVAAEAPPGAAVLVQDYHLSLVGTSLAETRPDLRTVHFTHTPFYEPVDLRVLPDDVAAELLRGLVSFTACGFHTKRWEGAFRACCEEVLGRTPATFVAPLGPDADQLTQVATSDACIAEAEALAERVGDRRLIVRVDRIELSKNVLRGFLAYEELLMTRPEWVGRVVFAAYVYPSREGLPEYLAYRQEVEAAAERVNRRWGTPAWLPVLLDTEDRYIASIAALTRYDVLLVNPLCDGLNLVAKEGPLVNRRDGVLALSREAGAWDELFDGALEINPFDIAGTADILARALDMSAAERSGLAGRARAAAAARRPRDWLDDQLRAAAGTRAVAPRTPRTPRTER